MKHALVGVFSRKLSDRVMKSQDRPNGMGTRWFG